ncbi:MAG: DUF6293 family protein [Nitrososphaerales archaeon]
MPENIIQIASFGESENDIIAGIRNFPINKLAILCYEDQKPKAEEFATRLGSTLGIQVNYMTVSRNNLFHAALERIAELIKNESGSVEHILMNVSGGDKILGSAALCAAFVNGIKVFGMDNEDHPMLLPVLKLTYNEVISAAKIQILKAIDKAGGSVESLEQLVQLSHLGKPLLSYHIQGSNDARGLTELGLVEAERGKGRLRVVLTTMGKLCIMNTS